MEMLADLAAIVAPVFICASIGVVWARFGTPFDIKLVTSLVYNVAAPCLIVSTFAKVKVGGDILGQIALASLACYVAFAAIGAVVLKATRLSLPAYLPSLMFPLTGSMGLPVCFFAFGEEGLAYGLVFFVFGAIGTFTIGNAVAAGKMSLDRLVRTPVIYAVVIAIGLQLADLETPKWILNTTTLIGGIVIPSQLVALGLSLAGLRVAGLGRSLALSVFRLAMGAAVGFAIAEAFGLTGAAWAVVILQSAMPVAVSNYLWAQLYGREPEEVAGMVLISTAISFATLPLLLWLVL